MKRITSKRILFLGLLVPLLAFACRTLSPSSVPELPALPDVEVQLPGLPEITSQTIPYSGDDQSLVELYARVNPAVVNITIYGDQDGVVVPISQGSGFVYDLDGNIVTNAHVVHGAEQIEVTFADATVRPAEAVGEDLNSDLAVVKVLDMPAEVIPLPLAEMESLAVGQSVVAIGNPFGLEGTLTRGIISALGRNIPALTPFSIPQSIQTDAAINPGNSGGPLLNLNGEVVGVNAQIETGGTTRSNLGVGFAIPVSIVRLVVPDLIQNGEHAWAWLGVRGGNVTPVLVQAMDLPVETGAYLAEVIANGPADDAGLKGANDVVTVDGRTVDVGGDVITAIDGQPVRTFDDLLIYIALHTGPGKQVTLSILRDGQPQDVQVALEERPTSMTTIP